MFVPKRNRKNTSLKLPEKKKKGKGLNESKTKRGGGSSQGQGEGIKGEFRALRGRQSGGKKVKERIDGELVAGAGVAGGGKTVASEERPRERETQLRKARSDKGMRQSGRFHEKTKKKIPTRANNRKGGDRRYTNNSKDPSSKTPHRGTTEERK